VESVEAVLLLLEQPLLSLAQLLLGLLSLSSHEELGEDLLDEFELWSARGEWSPESGSESGREQVVFSFDSDIWRSSSSHEEEEEFESSEVDDESGEVWLNSCEWRLKHCPADKVGQQSGLIRPLHNEEGERIVLGILVGLSEEVETVKEGGGELSEESLVTGGMSIIKGELQ